MPADSTKMGTPAWCSLLQRSAAPSLHQETPLAASLPLDNPRLRLQNYIREKLKIATHTTYTSNAERVWKKNMHPQ